MRFANLRFRCPSSRRAVLCGALALLLPLPAGGQPSAANEPPDGFVALFNGRDLTGWQGLAGDPPQRAGWNAGELAAAQAAADERMRAHWRVDGGVLRFDGQGDNLCTVREYEDFELLVDWRIGKGGDSGIYLRGTPQVQIWDNPLGSGGLYNNQAHPSQPLLVADAPVGHWNTFRILLVGDRVTVYLNRVLVVDQVPLENYWDRGQPLAARGSIELQSHKTPLSFRNIFIRELPRTAPLAAGPVLLRGDHVVIVGDSITEQRLYSRFIEDYLIACVPELELKVTQLGWSGETAPGFAKRMDNDLLPLKPDVVTTCFGMNDGKYRPYEAGLGQTYADALREIVTGVGQSGARVVIGSPGAVDTDTFRRPELPATVYNDNLAQLRDLSRELARQTGHPFANVHDHMILAMLRAKPVRGAAYHVCGADGFHPAANGHLVMAYAFLMSLGCDGDIGTFTLTWPAAATASAGHRVVGASTGRMEVESTRYPFCFAGDEEAPDAARSILPFIPFQADLNRLRLVVNGLPTGRAKVTWGATREFTREQLETGVNLAAEFPDNPFGAAFERLDETVVRKQAFETPMIKEAISWLRGFRNLLPDDAEAEAAMSTLRARLGARHAALQAEARAAVTPVRHTIAIEPLE